MEVVIEHLEPFLSKWLWLEYKHASQIAGRDNLTFTNVKDDWEYYKLSQIGRVEKASIVELIENGVIGREDFIFLDPSYSSILHPQDFKSRRGVVVGGILGDHPPRKRTRQLLTSKLARCIARSLGPHQFSIDGSVYMARQVCLGFKLSEIPIQVGLTIKVNKFHEIYLPYAYPLVNGVPLVAPGLIEYLKSDEIVKDEELLIRSGFVGRDF